MSRENPVPLIPRGQPAPPTTVVLYPAAYRAVIAGAQARLPAETIGGLIGTAHLAGDSTRIEIRDALPLALDRAGPGAALEQGTWDALQAQVTASTSAGDGVVGWFYADPGIGMFRPRLDLAAVQRRLAIDGGLLLVVNPVADEGRFYRWTANGWAPLAGFFVAQPEASEPATLPWDGTLRGGDAWFAAAGVGAETGLGAGPAGPHPGPAPDLDDSTRDPAIGRSPRRWGRTHWRVVLASGGALLGFLLLAGLGAFGVLGTPNTAPTPQPDPITPRMVVTATPPVAGPTPATRLSPPAPGFDTTPPTAVVSAAPSPAPITTPTTAVVSAATTTAPQASALPIQTAVDTPPPAATQTAGSRPQPAATPPVQDTPPLVPPAPLHSGARGRVSGPGISALVVHATPSLQGRRVGAIPAGRVVTIVAGPRLADGITWWEVTGWDLQGTPGWVAGLYLTAVQP